MTECAKCGDCCQTIYISSTKKWMRTLYKTSDPRVDENWERWQKNGYTNREMSIGNWLDANFIIEHWHKNGGGGTMTTFSCDAFDPETRLCTAHDDRPPVCSGYPWYDKAPRKIKLADRCSFWHDLPKSDWAQSAVPVKIRRTTESADIHP